MPPVTLTSQLTAATSLLDLARRLGAICLQEGALAAKELANERVQPISTYIEKTVAAIDPDACQMPRAPGGFTHLLEFADLAYWVGFAETHHPVQHLAFLRGLCRRALPVYFERTEERIALDRGMPVPFVTRPMARHYGGRLTPHQRTLGNGKLLQGLGHRYFEHDASGLIGVTLDHGSRERVDELTWAGARRLPIIATLHPSVGPGGLDWQAEGPTGFFDVRPTRWSLDEVLAQLEAVASEAQIAVLPELCLPGAEAVEAFEAALAGSPQTYPALIVAGSAHLRIARDDGLPETRVNESRIYLDGHRVAVHRKIHPYVAELDPNRPGVSLTEGLTNEPKTITVLSGSYTRLAVVICADLNDDDIPGLLERAGVNLLLVPALTLDPGAFNGAITGLASRCQGVSVIANADVDGLVANGNPMPFRVMAAIPHPDPAQQSQTFPQDGDPRGSLCVINPNVELGGAMRWMTIV